MSAREDDLLARVALSHLAEPGDPRVCRLAHEVGARPLLDGLLQERSVQGLLEDTETRAGVVRPDHALDQAARAGIRFVCPGDDEWPERLTDLDRAPSVQDRGGVPVGLWLRGPARLDEFTEAVAVVGARSATTYGTDTAGALADGVAAAGRPVVSGAAFGIDQAAHRGALAAGGRTAAVLACGVDRIYPKAHQVLLEHLAAEHLVVSESPPGWSPTRIRFLSRNRLIAALGGGTVVVEAAARSGALNTANWTSRVGRHLMVVPGPVTSALSVGAHQLVRDSAAVLVTCAEDVLEVLAPAGEHLTTRPRGQDRPADRLTPRQRQVLDAVPVARAADVFSVARTAGLGLREVRGALERLLEEGLVRNVREGWRLAAGDPVRQAETFLD